jgi:hypothetical protein
LPEPYRLNYCEFQGKLEDYFPLDQLDFIGDKSEFVAAFLGSEPSVYCCIKSVCNWLYLSYPLSVFVGFAGIEVSRGSYVRFGLS